MRRPGPWTARPRSAGCVCPAIAYDVREIFVPGMFVLGHIGIGRQLVMRWSDRLPGIPLALGMLLPDIIDKPLYYSRISPLISCTRTIGHTGLLLLVLLGCACAFRSRVLAAIVIGASTHSVLDCVLELSATGQAGSAWIALAWPLISREFTTYYVEIPGHVAGLSAWPVLSWEAVGGMMIVWELWRRRVRGVRASIL